LRSRKLEAVTMAAVEAQAVHIPTSWCSAQPSPLPTCPHSIRNREVLRHCPVT